MTHKAHAHGNGSGSVYFVPWRKSPWIASLVVGWTSGKMRRVSRYRATETEARKVLEEMRVQVAAGLRPNRTRHRPLIDLPDVLIRVKSVKRPRRAISPRTRWKIFERDGFTCRYCGSRAPDVVLHLDHVEPLLLGGSDDPANLVTACETCNLGKGERVLVAEA